MSKNSSVKFSLKLRHTLTTSAVMSRVTFSEVLLPDGVLEIDQISDLETLRRSMFDGCLMSDIAFGTLLAL